MGINYYLIPSSKKCEHCGTVLGDSQELEHIGKTSLGWHFQFNTTVYKTVEAWRRAIDACVAAGGWISDAPDTGNSVPVAAFWALIDFKRTSPNCAAQSAPGSRFGTGGTTCHDGVDLCPFEFS